MTEADMYAQNGVGVGGAPIFSPFKSSITKAAAMSSGVATTAGLAVLITASGAGTVTITLSSGQTMVVNPQVGDNIYPFSAIEVTTGTATVTAYYNLS